MHHTENVMEIPCSNPRLLEIALKQCTSTYMSVLQCNYMYLYQISFMHITINKLSIKHNQSRHRLPRHSSHRLTHPLPGSVPLSLDWSIHHHLGMCRMKYKPCWRFWHPHLLEMLAVALSQEHLIIFNKILCHMEQGAHCPERLWESEMLNRRVWSIRVSDDPRLADGALGPVTILLLASVPWPRFPWKLHF